QRINPREIIFDHSVGQVLEDDLRGDAKSFCATHVQMSDKHRRRHIVGSPTEPAQNPRRFGTICWLAQYLAVERDQGIGSEHDIVRPKARYDKTLPEGVPARCLAQSNLSRDDLPDFRRYDFVLEPGLC